MFRVFDQISFYPITEAELDAAQASGTQGDLVRVEDVVLDLAAHEAWADANREDIAATAAHRARAIEAAPFLGELTRPSEDAGAAAGGSGWARAEEEEEGGAGEEDGCEKVKAGIPGRCWRLLVQEGDRVKAGSVLVSPRLSPISFFFEHYSCLGPDALILCDIVLTNSFTAQIYLESCKMEVMIPSPVDGVCVKTHVKEGDVVEAHDTLIVIRPDPGEEPSDA